MDDFGLLVGRYHASFATLADQELAELVLDASGRLVIAGRYLEDAAHASGDAGLFMLAVRNDADTSMVSADGNYAPLQVDENGRLKVVADLEVANSAEKIEDSAHASEDVGSYSLGVRADTRPTNANTSADGDYCSFFINANGELYVKDTDALAKLTEIDNVLDTIKTDTAAMVVDLAAIEAELLAQGITLDGIETEVLDQGTTLDNIETSIDNIEADIDSLTKAEDSAHISGDSGIMSLAVRADSDGSLVSADGDYAPLQVDSAGKLKVAGDVTIFPVGSEQYTVTDALAGGGDGLVTITALATPWVTVASLVHTSGTAYIYGYQWACDQNAQVRLVADVFGTTTVYKTGLNSSAEPGNSEHWGDGGRIEIAGVANMEIRLQIKKRSATHGNANGTGSIHIRTA